MEMERIAGEIAAMKAALVLLISTYPDRKLLSEVLADFKAAVSSQLGESGDGVDGYLETLDGLIRSCAIGHRQATWLYESRTWRSSPSARTATGRLRREWRRGEKRPMR